MRLPKEIDRNRFTLVLDSDLTVKSETIKPINKGGAGLLEVKKNVATGLPGYIMSDGRAEDKKWCLWFSCQLQRRPKYILQRFCLPECITGTLCGLVWFIPRTDVADRLSFASTLLLTLFAINISAVPELPKVRFSVALLTCSHCTIQFRYSA